MPSNTSNNAPMLRKVAAAQVEAVKATRGRSVDLSGYGAFLQGMEPDEIAMLDVPEPENGKRSSVRATLKRNIQRAADVQDPPVSIEWIPTKDTHLALKRTA